MYCKQCGAQNPDTELRCASCGAALQNPYQSTQRVGNMGPAGPPISNYLVQSILCTLCCCLPIGIVAIVFAAQVNTKLAVGDIAGAQYSADQAKMWCWISFGLGFVIVLLQVGLMVAGILGDPNFGK